MSRQMPPESGFYFPGEENLRHDIYPAISASSNPSLHQPGKVVLITGAGRGCGRAMVLQYAHAGVASLILVARTTSQLDQVEREILDINSKIRVHKFAVDVSNEDQISKCAEAVKEKEGGLDILINNAGMSDPWKHIAETKPTEWWNTFEVNLKGVYLFTRAFLPLLVATAEKKKTVVDVINISSIGALVSSPGSSAYCITKFALLKFADFVNMEYREKGVNCLSLHPGGVKTELSGPMDVIHPCK
jgi:NAD(P)-dependent dehydrogenase (short-subunit alcohol dehydrogenase family)